MINESGCLFFNEIEVRSVVESAHVPCEIIIDEVLEKRDGVEICKSRFF